MVIDLEATEPAGGLVERLAHPPADDVAAVGAWWRADNFPTVGQIYLIDNALLRKPLTFEHIKPRPSRRDPSAAGCWATGHQPGSLLRLRSRKPPDPTRRTGAPTDYVDGVFGFRGDLGGSCTSSSTAARMPTGSECAGSSRRAPPPRRSTWLCENRASRCHLVMDALNDARRTQPGASDLAAWCQAKLTEHQAYVIEHLEDMPEARDWVLDDWAEQDWARLRP